MAQSLIISENETSVSFRLDSFAIEATDLDPDTFQGQDFSIDFGQNQTSEPADVSNSLSVPENLLTVSMAGMNLSAGVPRITNVAYLTDALFPTRQGHSLVVGGTILAATLSVSAANGKVEKVKVANLDPPVRLVFLKKPEVRNGANTTCSFWDFTANGEQVAN